MFYHTVFMLTIAVWMKQIIIVHHIILIPQLKYQPPNQDYIYNNSSTEGVNIYLTEQLSNPVSSTLCVHLSPSSQAIDSVLHAF
jgi:type IV secretory pathway protease TraF